MHCLRCRDIEGASGFIKLRLVPSNCLLGCCWCEDLFELRCRHVLGVKRAIGMRVVHCRLLLCQRGGELHELRSRHVLSTSGCSLRILRLGNYGRCWRGELCAVFSRDLLDGQQLRVVR